MTYFDAPLHTAVETYAKYMLKCTGDETYCSIVCIKPLTEEVKKCCLLSSVSFQRVFLSGSRSNQYKSTKGKKKKLNFKAGEDHPHTSYSCQQFSRGCVRHYTLLGRKGWWLQPWLSLAKFSHFALVCMAERLRLPTCEQTKSFLAVQDNFTSVCSSSRKQGNVYLSWPRMITALQAACLLVE